VCSFFSLYVLFFYFYFFFVLEGKSLRKDVHPFFLFTLFFLEGSKLFLGSCKVAAQFSSIRSDEGPRLKNLRFSNSFRI
jgi:hypothetical protein